MSVSRSRGETRAFWQRQVNAWSDSGLSKAAFCRKHDLQPASLGQWSRRLTPMTSKRRKASDSGDTLDRSSEPTSISMIPVTVVDESRSIATAPVVNEPSIVARNAHVSLTLPVKLSIEQASTWLRALASLDVQH